MSAPRRVTWVGLVVSICLASLFAIWRVGAGDPVTNAVENMLLDLRFSIRGTVEAPQDIVILEVDRAFVEEYGWTPPPRAAIARAIGAIDALGPAAIAVDLLFLERSAGDAELDQANSGSVILAIASTESGRRATTEDSFTPSALQAVALDRSTFDLVVGADTGDGAGDTIALPTDSVLGKATLGHVNIVRSSDRVARRIPLAVAMNDAQFVPAMPLAALRAFLGTDAGEIVLFAGNAVRVGDREIATDAAGGVVLNHYGPQGSFASFSLLDAIEGRIPAQSIRGKVVFIGATDDSLGDRHATPFGSDIPGVEIIATLLGNLMDRSLVNDGAASGLLSVMLAAAGAAACYLAGASFARIVSTVAVVAVWGTALAILLIAFSDGNLWLDATSVVGGMAVANVISVGQRLTSERARASQLGKQRDNLSQFVAPQLAAQLAEGGAAAFKRKTVTASVMFVDVAGFTALSEDRSPEEVTAFLRDLHQHYQGLAEPFGGVVISYEGDGALIAFGITDRLGNPAADAIAAGREIKDRADAFRSILNPESAIRLRVSIHHGDVSFDVVGAQTHAQITVSGDIVNVASRLQDIAKSANRTLVISGECWMAANAAGSGLDTSLFENIGTFGIRGRQQTAEVWAYRA